MTEEKVSTIPDALDQYDAWFLRVVKKQIGKPSALPPSRAFYRGNRQFHGQRRRALKYFACFKHFAILSSILALTPAIEIRGGRNNGRLRF